MMPIKARAAASLISIALILFAAPAISFADDANAGLWGRYKDAFISSDGRTVDYYQGQISHSEGQGYAMLLAVSNNDRETFDRVWRWTRDNIAARLDSLFAWQWGRRVNSEWAVIDYNNATDGDILIAYALLKAGEKWKETSYIEAAKKTIAGVRVHLSVTWKGKVTLLPSYYGFVNNGVFEINMSYLIFPALRDFAGYDDAKFWTKVYDDGVSLASDACFGSFCLPADWVVLGAERAEVSRGRSVYFGAESIRTLLNLASSGARLPNGARRLIDFYNANGYIPLRLDLLQDAISVKAAPAGYYAIYSVVARALGDAAAAKKLRAEAESKLKAEKDDYYSFSLFLLSSALAK